MPIKAPPALKRQGLIWVVCGFSFMWSWAFWCMLGFPSPFFVYVSSQPSIITDVTSFYWLVWVSTLKRNLCWGNEIQEIPYGLEHRLMDWKELRDGSLRIEQHIITHKQSQRKILVGKKGSKIGYCHLCSQQNFNFHAFSSFWCLFLNRECLCLYSPTGMEILYSLGWLYLSINKAVFGLL